MVDHPKNHHTHINGTKHRHGMDIYLTELAQDATLALEAEPDNKYDRNAVKVMHDDIHLGYIPKEFAPTVGRLIENAQVVRVTRDGESRYGIRIFYTEPEAKISHE